MWGTVEGCKNNVWFKNFVEKKNFHQKLPLFIFKKSAQVMKKKKKYWVIICKKVILVNSQCPTPGGTRVPPAMLCETLGEL